MCSRKCSDANKALNNPTNKFSPGEQHVVTTHIVIHHDLWQYRSLIAHYTRDTLSRFRLLLHT